MRVQNGATKSRASLVDSILARGDLRNDPFARTKMGIDTAEDAGWTRGESG